MTNRLIYAIGFYLLLLLSTAQADCSGQFPASTFCGNSGGSKAVPGPVPFSALPGSGTVTSVAAGTGMSFSTITGAGSVTIDKASNASAWGAISNKVMTADILNSAGTPTALTDGATISIDPVLGIDFSLLFTTHGGTRTLANPTTTMPAGRKGCIWVTQDATGGEGLTLDTSWMTAGGLGLTLSTGANAVDLVCYAAKDSTHILITVSQLDVKH